MEDAIEGCLGCVVSALVLGFWVVVIVWVVKFVWFLV